MWELMNSHEDPHFPVSGEDPSFVVEEEAERVEGKVGEQRVDVHWLGDN